MFSVAERSTLFLGGILIWMKKEEVVEVGRCSGCWLSWGVFELLSGLSLVCEIPSRGAKRASGALNQIGLEVLAA